MTPDAGVPTGPRRLHESVIEVMADAVIGTDLDYRVTLWNPAAERLYGYSAEEAMGRPARELATYENDTSRLRLEAALDRDGIAHVEFRARTESGVWRDVELIATAVLDEAGDPVGYLGIHRDVSARNRADLEHRRLSAVIQASPDFIGVSDLEGWPLFLNQAGQRLAGLDGMEEVRAHHIAEFFAPEVRAALRDELLPRLLTHGREAWELDFLNFRTGERIPVSWDAFRIDDPDTASRSPWRRSAGTCASAGARSRRSRPTACGSTRSSPASPTPSTRSTGTSASATSTTGRCRSSATCWESTSAARTSSATRSSRCFRASSGPPPSATFA